MLFHNGRVVGAMYSAACRGMRERRKSVPPGAYPFFDVPCEACKRKPVKSLPGHRNGLCQTGAYALAAEGRTAHEILAHYYPATTIAGGAQPSRPAKKRAKRKAG